MKFMKQEDSFSKDLRQALLSYIWNSLRNLPVAPSNSCLTPLLAGWFHTALEGGGVENWSVLIESLFIRPIF